MQCFIFFLFLSLSLCGSDQHFSFTQDPQVRMYEHMFASVPLLHDVLFILLLSSLSSFFGIFGQYSDDVCGQPYICHCYSV